MWTAWYGILQQRLYSIHHQYFEFYHCQNVCQIHQIFQTVHNTYSVCMSAGPKLAISPKSASVHHSQKCAIALTT